jgi:Domain of Unknown Function (DUF1080)
MHTLVTLIALASLGQSPAPEAGKEPAPAKAEEPWTPLFNGKDLSGWADADADDNGSSWEVAGGVIEGRGGGWGKDAILVFTGRQDFRDFKLRVTFGCRSDPGFAAVQLRRTPPGEATNTYAVAATVNPHRMAKDWPSGNIARWRGYRTGDRWPVPRKSEPVKAAAGHWHVLEIHAVAGTITTYVNGQQADQFTDRKGGYRSGGIGLFVGGDSIVQFREVSIQELTAE